MAAEETRARNLPTPWGMYAAVGFVGVIMIAAVFYALTAGTRMTAKYAPLVDAAMEIKLEATIGHLWFEEIVSGDRHEAIEYVWERLDSSVWYTNAMLNGDESEEGVFIALRDPQMARQLEQVLRSKRCSARSPRSAMPRWEPRRRALARTWTSGSMPFSAPSSIMQTR